MHNKRPNLIVITALAALALWALFASVVNPAWARWNRLQRELVMQRRQLSHLRAAVARQQTERDSDVGRTLTPLWMKPSDAEHGAYTTRMITRLCEQTGMELQSVEPMTARQEKDCLRHPARISVTGDLSGVTDMLLGINMLKGALDVERLSLRSNDSRGNLTVEMTVSTFSRKET